MDQIYTETLQWVTTFILQHDYAPTFKEIGEGMFIGTSTAHYRINKLKRFGKINSKRGKARSITLT